MCANRTTDPIPDTPIPEAGGPPQARARELARRNQELSILNAIAQALNSTLDLDQALGTVLGLVAKLLGLETGWVFLLDEETEEFYLAAAQHLPPGLAEEPDRLAGSCYCLDTYLAGDMDGAANVNVVLCSRLHNLMSGTAGLAYHASIPLYAQGKEVGVLNVASPDWRELSPEDLDLLHTVGDLLGMAVERARLFARSAELGALQERNRLAREIHDTLAQRLTAIILQLETTQALLDAGAKPAQLQETVASALALARAGLEEARRSVADLRAAPLEGRTLAEALAMLAQEVQASAGLPMEWRLEGSVRPLPVRAEVGLYRIAEEALRNVVEHAQASHAQLLLTFLPRQVRLTVADDGIGFDPLQTPPDAFGIRGMRERAQLLGGSLLVQSRPGQGARLLVTLPLGGQP